MVRLVGSTPTTATTQLLNQLMNSFIENATKYNNLVNNKARMLKGMLNEIKDIQFILSNYRNAEAKMVSAALSTWISVKNCRRIKQELPEVFPLLTEEGKKWYQKRGKASLSYSVYLQGISLSTPLQYYYKYKNRIEELTIEIEELVQSNT
jgi:Zn-dependent M32 family carboxypeptidase